MYVYIYIYIYVCVYTYIYIYIGFSQVEQDTEQHTGKHRKTWLHEFRGWGSVFGCWVQQSPAGQRKRGNRF